MKRRFQGGFQRDESNTADFNDRITGLTREIGKLTIEKNLIMSSETNNNEGKKRTEKR